MRHFLLWADVLLYASSRKKRDVVFDADAHGHSHSRELGE
jgi:hypothetical protein